MSDLEQLSMLVGGKPTGAISGRTFESQNPYTGQSWAVIPDGAAEDVDAAVNAARAALDGDPDAIRFPRGLSRASDLAKHRYDFSFSGLKTAVARWVERFEAENADGGAELPIADVAASFREAVVDVLVTKALAACADLGVPRLLLGGGVIANRRLREVALQRAETAGVTVRIPPLSLCTDNGAMIAVLGAEVITDGGRPSRLDIGADSSLPVDRILV